jgi:hypothetical protein
MPCVQGCGPAMAAAVSASNESSCTKVWRACEMCVCMHKLRRAQRWCCQLQHPPAPHRLGPTRLRMYKGTAHTADWPPPPSTAPTHTRQRQWRTSQRTPCVSLRLVSRTSPLAGMPRLRLLPPRACACIGRLLRRGPCADRTGARRHRGSPHLGGNPADTGTHAGSEREQPGAGSAHAVAPPRSRLAAPTAHHEQRSPQCCRRSCRKTRGRCAPPARAPRRSGRHTCARSGRCSGPRSARWCRSCR